MKLMRKLRQIKKDMIKSFKNGNLNEYMYKQNVKIYESYEYDNTIEILEFPHKKFCIYLNLNIGDGFSGYIFGGKIDECFPEPILSEIDYKSKKNVSFSCIIWANVKNKYPCSMYKELSKLKTDERMSKNTFDYE